MVSPKHNGLPILPNGVQVVCSTVDERKKTPKNNEIGSMLQKVKKS